MALTGDVRVWPDTVWDGWTAVLICSASDALESASTIHPIGEFSFPSRFVIRSRNGYGGP